MYFSAMCGNLMSSRIYQYMSSLLPHKFAKRVTVSEENLSIEIRYIYPNYELCSNVFVSRSYCRFIDKTRQDEKVSADMGFAETNVEQDLFIYSAMRTFENINPEE